MLAVWNLGEALLRVALCSLRSLFPYSVSWDLSLLCFFTRFIQGSAAQSPYSFYHWQYIDIFVYFSHHMVTIPPVGWTNAAHRHGVCVLGKSQACERNAA